MATSPSHLCLRSNVREPLCLADTGKGYRYIRDHPGVAYFVSLCRQPFTWFSLRQDSVFISGACGTSGHKDFRIFRIFLFFLQVRFFLQTSRPTTSEYVRTFVQVFSFFIQTSVTRTASSTTQQQQVHNARTTATHDKHTGSSSETQHSSSSSTKNTPVQRSWNKKSISQYKNLRIGS